MGKVLKDWAQAERDQFDSELSGGNCSCHIAPPCGSCTHPGNPLNQAEDEDCWEWETIAEILDEMEMGARAAIAKTIDASISKHIAEMRATQAAKQGGEE